MMKRMVIYSANADLAERAAAAAAEELGWFYLSLDGLVLYNGNRISAEALAAEGTYDKYFKQSLRDAAEYENTVVSVTDSSAVYALVSKDAAIGEVTENGVKTLDLDKLNGCSAFFTVDGEEDFAAAAAAVYGGIND